MVLLQLFFSFFKVGLFGIGGAYALIPLLEREIVTNNHWLTTDEFLRVTGLTQALPGAISMKLATYTGQKVAGMAGIATANLGIMLPPVIATLILVAVLRGAGELPFARSFLRGVQAATWGLIIGFGVALARTTGASDLRVLALAAAAFTGIAVLKLHPGLIIILGGILGVLLFSA